MIPNDLEISSRTKFPTQSMQSFDFCKQFSYSFSNAQDQSPRRFVTEPPNLLPVRSLFSGKNMILQTVLIFTSLPFVVLTLYFGSKGGYYDSENYTGDGCAHDVKR